MFDLCSCSQGRVRNEGKASLELNRHGALLTAEAQAHTDRISRAISFQHEVAAVCKQSQAASAPVVDGRAQSHSAVLSYCHASANSLCLLST